MWPRWKQHCRFVKLAQRVTRWELHFIEQLRASSQLQAANKVSGQGESTRGREPLVSPTAGAERSRLMSFTPASRLTPGPDGLSDSPRASSGGDYLYFYRYLWSVSSGQPAVTLLALLRPLLKRLFPKQRFLSLLCQSTAAHLNPQLRKEVWLHAEGHQGVCLWRGRLHRLPHGLGRNVFVCMSVFTWH